ncbi:glycoside hydrolase superfamily, partial [Pestalotiopsis sp. NC0098]
ANYTQPKWWKEAVVYQVYPASFNSSKSADEADGWGDINGIIDKVPYLKSLGVDVIWSSPLQGLYIHLTCSIVYKSPQADMGYDIADYKAIDARYGTLSDMDNLIKTCKDHDMKIIMDLVVTHTSDQHDWFLESAKSKTSPKRDWYIWKPPRGYDEAGKPIPPNNWAQILGDANSAWTWSEVTQEFYLTLHTPEQVDLNWENPDVVSAVHDVMEFWLSRGIAGFRMDVINLISKDPTFPDAPIVEKDSKYQPGEKYYTNGPRFHEFMHDIYDNVLSKYDTLTVGETPYVTDIEEIIKTVGATAKELNMILIFDHMELEDVKIKGDSKFSMRSWKLTELKDIMSGLQKKMIQYDGWNAIFFECHDQARSVTRYTDDGDEFRGRGAKLLSLLQTTLGGTIYIYQGQEIGMRNFSIDWDPDVDYKDVESINYWNKMKSLYPKGSEQLEEARRILQRKARDNARTPMQWSSEPNAGFTVPGVKPWMRVCDDYETVNVKAQMEHKSQEGGELSVWQHWQRALQLRKKQSDVFVYGGFEDVDHDNEDVYAYKRIGARGGEEWIVVMNWTGKEIQWKVPEGIEVAELVSSTVRTGKVEQQSQGFMKLQSWEGVLGIC